MKLNCIICNKEFTRFGKQAKSAKCCSFKCLGVYNKAPDNFKCTECDKNFHKKISRKTSKHGNFCSIGCYGNWKSKNLFGLKNPNFRNKMYNSEGSRIIWSDTFGRIKMHHAITFEILKINKIPKNYHVHHRDCNHKNNDPSNLVLLESSDHRWLHKQYGNATLWAFCNNKIFYDDLVDWSNDKERAKRLLQLNIIEQEKSGVFKSDKLLENL